MRTALRLLGVARRQAAWLGVAVVCMVVVAGATVFAYNLVRPLYDQVLGPGRAPSAGDAPALVGVLDGLALRGRTWLGPLVGTGNAALFTLVLLAVVAKNLFTLLARYAVARFGLATVRELRNSVFDSLLAQNLGYFYATPAGVLVARTVNDVRLVNEALSERFGDLLQDALTVVVVVAYVVSLNPRLALATMVVAPLLLAPVVHFSRRLRRASREAQERMGELASVLDETIKGIRVVQAFVVEGFLARRFRAATRRHFEARLRARTIQAANAPVMEVVGVTASLALIAYAGAEIAAGAMSLGDFSAFLVGVYGAYNPIKRLNKFNLALQQAVVASERVFEVVDAPVAVRDRPGAVALAGIGDGVRFVGVGFGYEPDRPVLREIDLELPAGATVAVVGPSGAGKSTLAQLIPRFWDVDRGAVVVGGHDVRELELRSLRERIGLVTQETLLFHDTVRANIVFGRHGVAPSETEAAARAALADDFVAALEHGYDTVVGEGGMRLSAGQRQRLAIARALLKDPELLILDEATSSLDPEAECLVQRALENLMRGRTTLVIAHRLATVARADRIVVLVDGRIVERGRHHELVAAGGVYAGMVAMQELEGPWAREG